MSEALNRFITKCEFDPGTGCVIWTGGKTSGGGKTAQYGSFWDGRRWFAHRWAAQHIHGFDIEGLQVDHYCPHVPRPNTLCVEHVRPVDQLTNLSLQRLRQKWLLIDLGYWERDERHIACGQVGSDVPFFSPPGWLSLYHEAPLRKSSA